VFALQYEQHGYVSNSLIALNILHNIYILDFFWNEGWYLRTIGESGSAFLPSFLPSLSAVLIRVDRSFSDLGLRRLAWLN
jgi:hypothetical protein